MVFNPDGLKARMRSWRDLERFGFDVLTGEACGMSMRLLVDISPLAREILESLLSVNFTDDNNSWNHRHEEGWKSIMLARGLFPELAAYCLFFEGYKYVVHVNWRTEAGSSYYVEGFKREEGLEDFRAMANKVCGNSWRVWHNSGTAGLRNRHYMTGRVT